MYVLVWRSHGNISVRDISTPEKFQKQIQNIVEGVDGWGIDDEVKLVTTHLEKHPENMGELRRAFNTLRNAIGEGADNFQDLLITKVE